MRLLLQNVSPAHVPEVVVYIGAITIVLEEAVKGGPPLSLPIASIEAGDEHSLPNLALRFSLQRLSLCAINFLWS